MWHFCKSSTIFDEVLPTVYDTMYTKGAKIEERDPLFSPQHKGSYRSTNNICKGIPQKFGWNQSPTNQSFAVSAGTLETPSGDNFKTSLKFEKHENLQANIKLENNLKHLKNNWYVETNLEDQRGESTYYFCWSGLDLAPKI